MQRLVQHQQPRRGVAQATSVGYWMGQPYAGQGLMTDGLRATLNFERFGLAADSKVGLWGYSGGGLASAWAAVMVSK